jgi:hypothetical protein
MAKIALIDVQKNKFLSAPAFFEKTWVLSLEITYLKNYSNNYKD